MAVVAYSIKARYASKRGIDDMPDVVWLPNEAFDTGGYLFITGLGDSPRARSRRGT